MTPKNVEHLFPIKKSFLSSESLAHSIEAAYNLSNVHCQLITASMRDVYLVMSNERRYVLYVYRCGQRTPEEILAEWKFVDFLSANGISVAPAVPNINSELLMTFEAPEGTRHGVLAPFVDGKHLRQKPNIDAVRTYGCVVAQIHALADTMPFHLTRPINDSETLINQSVMAIDSVLTIDPEDKACLHEAATTLQLKMAAFPRQEPLYGMIHGDVIRANAQVSENGQVTVLDFDFCGLGWRAYDVATYLLVTKGLPDQDAQQQAFLKGYQEIRSLTEFEQEALPLFEAVRAIFDIGVKAANVYHWGSAYLHTFLGQPMEQLKQCMMTVQAKSRKWII
jgi:Ser/Thr protein kinase RdoA (MazF antagonist)